MKKRKIKLFASIASFAMVAAVAVTGILAATTATATINGAVTFSATQQVKATVALSATTTTTGTLVNPGEGGTVTFNGNEASPAEDEDTLSLFTTAGEKTALEIATITDLSQNFVITYTITVTNMADGNDEKTDLDVTITLGSVAGLAGTTAVASGTNVALEGTAGEFTATLGLDKTCALTVTYTFNPNTSIPADTDIGAEVELAPHTAA